MLRVNALEVNYGAISALHGVTLEANGGEIVAVVGANGGGKSTLLKAIAGFLRPRTGEITLDAKSLAGLSVEQRVRRGVALVPEGRQIWAELTVEEHLRLGCYGRRRERRLFQERLESVYTLFPRLFERRRQRGGTLSGGEQQMLAIGRALIAQPSVLLLDEPTLGLAPVVIESIGETLAKARSPERTVIVAEQNVDFALAIADRGYVLEVGEVRLEGEAEELRDHPELLDAYLGLAPKSEH
jgi:branched-chain amino acid transport system ATP-binding protein